MRTIIIVVLFVYSFFQLLKFLAGAVVSDTKSHFVHNWDSDEKLKENLRDLKSLGKSILAFILAGIIIAYF